MCKKDFLVCVMVFIASTFATIFFLWLIILISSTNQLDFLFNSLIKSIFLIISIILGFSLNFIMCLYSFTTIWDEKIK